MKKIVCLELDPKQNNQMAVAKILNGIVKQGMEVDLLTVNPRESYGSKLYARFRSLPPRFISFVTFKAQYQLARQLYEYRHEEAVFFVNTLLPTSALFVLRMLNKKIVFYQAKTDKRPSLKNRIKTWMLKKMVIQILYAPPGYQKNNALVRQQKALSFFRKGRERFVVFFNGKLDDELCIRNYVALAKLLAPLTFELVIQAPMSEIKAFFAEEEIPENLIVFPEQYNFSDFLQRADLLAGMPTKRIIHRHKMAI